MFDNVLFSPQLSLLNENIEIEFDSLPYEITFEAKVIKIYK